MLVIKTLRHQTTAKMIGILVLMLMTTVKVTSTTKQQLLNKWHLRHKLRIFSLHKKVIFHFQDIQVFDDLPNL